MDERGLVTRCAFLFDQLGAWWYALTHHAHHIA